MGWFSRSNKPVDTVRPVTRARVIDIFEQQEWHYRIDDDNDLVSRWGQGLYCFLFAGGDERVLQIASRLAPEIPSEHADELLILIEDWHRDRFWPKAFLNFNSDGALQLHSEVNIDYTHGATDAQLLQHIQCALSTCTNLFETVCDRFQVEVEED